MKPSRRPNSRFTSLFQSGRDEAEVLMMPGGSLPFEAARSPIAYRRAAAPPQFLKP
jgi:hypothetical protein